VSRYTQLDIAIAMITGQSICVDGGRPVFD
jgi:hypothetical protein